MRNSNDDELIKMAVNNDNETNPLLAYYRNRIHEFDQERRQWLEKVEELRYKQ